MGVVVVDARYDIRLINAAAQSLLAIHSPAVGEDLIHLLQGSAYTKLRPAVDASLRERRSVEIEEFVLEEPEDGLSRYLRMVIHPHAVERGQDEEPETGRTGDEPGSDSVMIIVDEVTTLGRERDTLKEQVAQQASELEQRGSLNQRLTERNRQLERGNQELTRMSEDLQASNEELSLSNEEAQAATEEVETLNEELQATIEELNTTTDDQQARDKDLQNSLRDGDRRQQWLASTLESLDLALLVVEGDGNTLLRNAVCEEMFGSADPELLDSEGGSLRRYEATGTPLKTDGKPKTASIVFREIQ